MREDADLLPGSCVEVGRNLCSEDQIADLWTSCLDPTTGAEDLCQAWLDDEAKQPCADCLWTRKEWGPIPVLLISGDLAWLPIFACEAMALGRPECAWPNQAYAHCDLTACRSCETDQTTEACYYAAEADVCGPLMEAVPPDCTDLFELATEPCNGTDFHETYSNIADYFCGPPG